MTSTPLVFVDTETTSLHPGHRRPWEIAMIRRHNGATTTCILQIIDVDIADADPHSLNVGRFWERHVRYRDPAKYAGADREPAPLFEFDAAQQVAEFTAGAHFVGVNPAFDADVLERMLRRNRLMPNWDYHLIDVPAMALGMLHAHAEMQLIEDAPELPYRSYELSKLCGVNPPDEDEQHTAYGDARWVERWYDAIVASEPSEVPLPHIGKYLTRQQHQRVVEILSDDNAVRDDTGRIHTWALELHRIFGIKRCLCGKVLTAPSPGCEWHAEVAKKASR
ncbi:3'-5' exonuclease [Rhodococcus sp. SGAir0479]|uniref:3'-5' exonuclease n=1 Tax=Rhodococcus sp. SGAir0479 TaxID=2567884 RepID=UPI0010CD2CFE|nr:hypothetical protein [Rhodococcus sp. SGAir0479]QCQ91751.1 hypothetical protein E7742_11255 [Rhodococcus sp. SGAir0479]